MKKIMLVLVLSIYCSLTAGCTNDSDKDSPKVSAEEMSQRRLSPEETKKAWKKLTTVNQEDYFKD